MTAPAPPGPHILAVRDLLRGQLPAAVKGDVGGAPPGALPPYWALYTDAGNPEGTLGDRHRDLLLEFQVTVVGTGTEQVLDVAGRVRSVLLTLLPAVAGRTVQPLWEIPNGEPIRRDDDLLPPLWYLPLTFQMRTEPAP
jgi:hypothetical protein